MTAKRWRWSRALVAGLCLAMSSPPHAAGTPSWEVVQQGSSGAILADPVLSVSENATELAAAWRRVFPECGESCFVRPPRVDFRRWRVIGIIVRTHSSTCARLSIARMERVGDTLFVHYVDDSSGEVCGQAFTTPYVFATVPRDGAAVRFIQDVPTPSQ